MASPLARCEQSGTSNALYYLVGDDLASTSLAMDDHANVVAEQRYYPYGAAVTVTGTLPTDYQFTGQLRDSYINLIQMGARWYDPTLNRWTQPDTIVPGAGNPQALNRYSFVLGNPLRYTDPSGHDVCAAGAGEGNGILLGCPNDTPAGPPGGDSETSASQDAGPVLQNSGNGEQVSPNSTDVQLAPTGFEIPTSAAEPPAEGENALGGGRQPSVTLYHGSIDNATSIRANGLDVNYAGPTYVSTDIAAAQDAINYRAQNFPQEASDPGLVSSTVPVDQFEALQQSGDIEARAYSGFYGAGLQSIEFLLHTPVAKALFNSGMFQ